jgi:cytochrome c oxidase accessory protein FixG
MCPYARFQSAMFDRNTLIIAYDPLRGEPRGPRKRGMASVLERARGLLPKALADDYAIRAAAHRSAADAQIAARATTGLADAAFGAAPLPKFATEELGDCIDCTLCVQVCPTGIDIRNGLQYECIACGACIDACDHVMEKMGYPRGLIRYSTQNAIDEKPVRVLRPRIFVYGILLLALMGGFAWGVTHRAPLIVEVLRDRNALYREGEGGRIENGYTLKLVNKTTQPQRYRVTLAAPAGIALRGGALSVDAKAEQVLDLPVTATAPAMVSGRHEVRFVVVDESGEARAEVESSFFGPMP